MTVAHDRRVAVGDPRAGLRGCGTDTFRRI